MAVSRNTTSTKLHRLRPSLVKRHLKLAQLLTDPFRSLFYLLDITEWYGSLHRCVYYVTRTQRHLTAVSRHDRASANRMRRPDAELDNIHRMYT
jgi:hypothetical protein